MRSQARTVAEYLKALPPDRRKEIAAVRAALRRRMPRGYEEVVNWGMITWQIPLRRYPDTYNGQPLCYAALAAQKKYNALYLMGCYTDPAQVARLREAFESAGKRFDMGKSCLRFATSGDLPLDAIAALVAETPPDLLIERHEASRAARTRGTARRRS